MGERNLLLDITVSLLIKVNCIKDTSGGVSEEAESEVEDLESQVFAIILIKFFK